MINNIHEKIFFLRDQYYAKIYHGQPFNTVFLRPPDICIHLDAAEEHGTNVASLPASYHMMSG